MYEEIIDQMQELLKDEIKNFSGDFGKLGKLAVGRTDTETAEGFAKTT